MKETDQKKQQQQQKPFNNVVVRLSLCDVTVCTLKFGHHTEQKRRGGLFLLLIAKNVTG